MFLKNVALSAIIILNVTIFSAFGIIEPIDEDDVIAEVLADNIMQCELTLMGPDYRISSIYWYYSTTSSGSTVKLFDLIENHNDSQTFTTKLTLSDVNPGYYQCSYTVTLGTGSDTKFAKFHDDSITGASYGSSCDNGTECLTLNAKCDEVSSSSDPTCNCNGAYDIPFSTSSSNVACFKHAEIGENCNIDDECVKENEELECDSGETNKCVCQGSITAVAEKNNAKMCLKPVDNGFDCIYNEECQLENSHSSCVNGKCECDDGYFYNFYSNRYRPLDDGEYTCVKMRLRDKFTPAVVAGISLAIIFAFAFFVGGIAVLVDLIVNR